MGDGDSSSYAMGMVCIRGVEPRVRDNEHVKEVHYEGEA